MGICWFRSVNGLLTPVDKPTDIIYRMRTSAWYKTFHRALKTYIAPAFFAACFLYIGVALANHAAYVVLDDWGLVCRDVAGAKNLAIGETFKVRIDNADRLPVFKANALCQNMGVNFVRNGRYLIKFKVIEPFRDDDVEASTGFYTGDLPSLWQRIVFMVGLPNRREWLRPWFRAVARIGSAGGEESFLDPDPDPTATPIEEKITAKRDGQLFLFVNDAVIGIPGLYGVFYDNNHGAAEVTITRQRR
jgi:hypothetical protein